MNRFVSFNNIYYLSGVTDELASAINLNYLENFRHVGQHNMRKVLIFYISKNEWELYQNLQFLMEVVLSGMEAVGDLGNSKKNEVLKETRTS